MPFIFKFPFWLPKVPLRLGGMVFPSRLARSLGSTFGGSAFLVVTNVIVAFAVSAIPADVFAQGTVTSGQVEAPTSDKVFISDTKDERKLQKKREAAIQRSDPAPGNRVDFKAPQISYDNEAKTVTGSGGVSLSGRGIRVQSDEATLDTETNDTLLKGDVVITERNATIEADSGTFNFNEETGDFKNTRFTLEEGGYQLRAGHASKLSELKYSLLDVSASNCGCETGTLPWEISADSCNITQEGYAHAYDATFRFYGVPIFYTPYIGFPAKVERASGLLAPTAGWSGQDGFIYRQPILGIIDESSDVIATPFLESKTRRGSFFDAQREFSRYHNVNARFLYSDESPRGDSLRGTQVEGIFDPQFDKDRTGFLYEHTWTTEPNSDFNLGYYADVHYIGDSLLLREIEDNGIGTRQSLYTVSTAALRSTIGQYVSAELVGEYNQSLEKDQDIVFQRLPEGNVDVLRTFRVFGENPFGMKLVTKVTGNAVNFQRNTGFEGTRSTVAPSVAIPFRIKNYYESSFALSVDRTHYDIQNKEELAEPSALAADRTNQTLPAFSYSASTGLERVYELDKDSALTQITSLGKDNQQNYLARLKHTIEPKLSYLYVPDRGQEDNYLFDAYDSQLQRSVVTYGLSTRLLGRFVPRLGSNDEIAEIIPRPQDLPMFDANRALGEIGGFAPEATMEGGLYRQGEIRELAALGISQSYNNTERLEDFDPARDVSFDGITTYRDPGVRPYSDVQTVLSLYPSSNLIMSGGAAYDPYDSEVSVWSLATSFRTDRGDALRGKYNYYRDRTTGASTLSQVEGNLEVSVLPQLRVGYYGRYDFNYLNPDVPSDSSEGDFIESRIAMRITPDCDCWYFDVGYSDLKNPDRQAVLFSVNFGGLGDISQDLSTYRQRTETTR